MLFDLKPREVLTNPLQHPYHSNRIEEAEINYPICVTRFKEREIVIDGIHRLAKIVGINITQVDIKLIDERSIQEIAIYA